MFYSQFILAKKGPLGTIWIAAHLERKLRKNQVADTDIGVSVDSILFPDVPIALRLSSHLLLGVVRIYSRKVNYLFHDCSEALLKIKQAFRSTAVDLPPEESTAPYHSITLPETFDLDDFELPDNAFLQGNYVDHHVSTREQITLQDTMEGMAYSTSQFGLDERFGDGDASQIGLDLDEELFLEKVPSSAHPSAQLGFREDVDPQTSGQPVTSAEMDIDGAQTSKGQQKLHADDCEGDNESNILDYMEADGPANCNDDLIQTPDVNEGPSADPGLMDFVCNAAEVPSSDFIDCAQAPSTPGLVMEAVPSLKKTSLHNVVEGVIGKSDLESLAGDSTKQVPKEISGTPLTETVVGPQNELNCASLNEKSSQTDIAAQNLDIESSCGMPESNGLFPSVGLISSDMVHSPPTSASIEPKPICSEATEPQADPLEMTTVPPGCIDGASGLRESYDKPVDGVATVPAHNGSFINCQPSSEGAPSSNICENVQHTSNTDPEALTYVGPEEGAEKDSRLSCSLSLTGADIQFGAADEREVENPCASVHVLQACSSAVSQPNSLPLEDNILVENAPDLSSKEVAPFTIEAQETEVQGAGGCSTDVTETNLDMQQMGSPLASEIRSELNKSDNHLEGLTSKDTHLETINCSASSELPAPETLLLAPTEVSDLPNDLVLESTAGKPVKEGEGTVERFDSLSGKKRHTMESTPVLENGSLFKFSGMPRSKRSKDYIPDDNDVLASILVGKRTPALKVRSTPPPAEVISSKRSRVTTRVSALKRKVLLDDTMVLHGDVIRKQLTNTEDIRRIRRKAPCTRKETWMIQKCLLEEEIFTEPLFNDMSEALTGLHKQTYDLTEIRDNPPHVKQSPLETIEELEISITPELIKETVAEGIDGSINAIPTTETAETIVQIGSYPSEHAFSSHGSDNQEQTEAAVAIDIPENGACDDANPAAAIGIEMLETGASDDVNHSSAIGVDMPLVSAPPGDDNNVSADIRIESSMMDKNDGTQTTHQKDDGSCFSPSQELPVRPADDVGQMNDERLHLTDNSFIEKDSPVTDSGDCAIRTIEVNHDTLVLDKGVEREESSLGETKFSISVDLVPQSLPQNGHDGVRGILNDETLVPSLDNCSVQSGEDVLLNSLATESSMNSSAADVALESNRLTDMAIATDYNGNTGIGTSELATVVEDDSVAREVTFDEGNPSIIVSTEGPQIASCRVQHNHEMENGPSDGEGLGFQEGIQGETAMDMEMPVTFTCAEGDSVDVGYLLDDNDTEFLNVDDEAETVEEEDDNVQTAEEDRFIENSGWSSRTRAVARYLRSLFDHESGRGMKMVPMDNLLAGKTRKEASRMFFETLVLKTKDYIHAEQESPCAKINIQPRAKLLKSDF